MSTDQLVTKDSKEKTPRGVDHGQGGALRCCVWLNVGIPEACTALKGWVMERYAPKKGLHRQS